ncbi:hypothetical protein SERLA73DRAFT_180246 [Serpula lacrymans var. lacrymans S7.3]|uniref:Glutaredoxin domain-containing protein n=2 Tax=Serpula lacrymans var. lacrymans TaxID=341189 RepID=F8PWB8_SERL3|nr:uncharacterized protein SERLADRAFT_465758 [Serpula lacrymans var. lacrymans S7.9]EGN99923.1 hypothetical protein SERLA73DRAFT_180246 [Serpula lacrymans var. lacrymans S7.3]EGO25492.1 hypothetical protein SERLADRAFT_465758 [Serpula lacrymans var. lacrymans S7.9]
MATDRSPRRANPNVQRTFPRRRRLLVIGSLLLTLAFFCFASPWGLPSALDIGGLGATLSRASIVQLVKSGGSPPDEIYGLLHFVTSGDDRMLSHSIDLDPSEPLDMDIYLGGDTPDWRLYVRRLKEEYPLVVFSKSYCPHSRRAKQLLATYDLSPPPKIIEVDLRDDGDFIKLILTRLTEHSTFPNIVLKGKSIGGSDDLHVLHAQGKLKRMFENAGMTVLEQVRVAA